MLRPILLAAFVSTAALSGCLETGLRGGEAADAPGTPAPDTPAPDPGWKGDVGSRDPWCADLATWEQPELYAALPAAAEDARASSFEESGARSKALPLARVPDGGALASVAWRPAAADGTPTREYFLLWFPPDVEDAPSPVIAALAPPERAEADLRALFDTFAETLTRAEPEARESWSDDFVGSKRPGSMSKRPGEPERVESHGYEVAVTAPLRLEDAWDALAEVREPTRVASGTEETLEWRVSEGDAAGEWEWRFEHGTRRLVLDTPEAPLALHASTSGHVRLHSNEIHDVTDDELRGWVARTFGEVGLPAPAFDGWSRGGGIC